MKAFDQAKTAAATFGIALLWLAAPACVTRPHPVVFDAALHRELVAMQAADQQLRDAVFSRGQTNRIADLNALDRRHTERMKEIIAAHGWPGRSLAGEDGAKAAWLLVQHATHDPGFMKRCLALMEKALRKREVSPKDFAYLTDRVRLQEHQPQIYGTQFLIGPDGVFKVQPIKDAAHVDQRRKQLGLPPLAEYEQQLRNIYHLDSGSPPRPPAR